MSIIEVRDSELARHYILQGLWLQRLGAVNSHSVQRTLRWMLELASNDEPLPSAGVVSDFSRLIFSVDEPLGSTAKREFDFLPPDLSRPYEDYVLGKLYADPSFERGSTAICRYVESDRTKGAAWLIAKILERSTAGGIRCSPNIIRTLQRADVDELIAAGSKSLRDQGLLPLLKQHYIDLTSGVRSLGELLAPEDVFELEHQTALAEFGQRLALRQTLAAANELERELPDIVPRSLGRDRAVVTNMVEEDCYPVGGFSSISTRGSIESLLQSQLSFMETEERLRPDLFDIKYLRSELLYYSRDENQFLRRRRTFVLALYPDLAECRVKDANVPFQRIILVLACVYVVVRKLVAWLGDESLKFRILFVTQRGNTPLSDEYELASMLLQRYIDSGTTEVHHIEPEDLVPLVEEHARHSLTHCVLLSRQQRQTEFTNALRTDVMLPKEFPIVHWDQTTAPVNETGLEAWKSAVDSLLKTIV